METIQNNLSKKPLSALSVAIFASLGSVFIGLVINGFIAQVAYNRIQGNGSLGFLGNFAPFAYVLIFCWPSLLISAFFINTKLKEIVRNNPDPQKDFRAYEVVYWIFYLIFAMCVIFDI